MSANVLSHETCHGHTALPAPASSAVFGGRAAISCDAGEWKRVDLCDGVMRGPGAQWECGGAAVALGGCHGTGRVRVTIFSRRNSYGEKETGAGL